MVFLSWLSEHWFDSLQSVGIVGGLAFTGYTTLKDERARKIGNSIAINHQYQKIWSSIYDHPSLARLFDVDADINDPPLTLGEEMFITTLIAHLSTVFRAMKDGEFVQLEGLEKDVLEFFKLPIQKVIWDKLKPTQDREFVSFVENCLRPENSVVQ